MARTTVELVWTDCVDTALCVDTEHEDGFREFMDGDEVVVCHAADADPAAEVADLRERLAQAEAERDESRAKAAYDDYDTYAAGAAEVRAQVAEVLEETDRSYRESNVAPGQRSVTLIQNLRALVGAAPEAAPEVPETVAGCRERLEKVFVRLEHMWNACLPAHRWAVTIKGWRCSRTFYGPTELAALQRACHAQEGGGR